MFNFELTAPQKKSLLSGFVNKDRKKHDFEWEILFLLHNIPLVKQTLAF